MIRMGRSNQTNQKPEHTSTPTEPNFDQNKSNQTSSYSSQNTDNFAPRTGSDSSNRAFTESENMARDIKEGRLSGFVGNGTTLTGETEFKTMLRVDGHLVGKVNSDSGTLVVGATGNVDANVTVAAAVINGTITGDVTVTERLELGRTAKIVGNVQTPSLMMEQGAILEGNCNMLKSKTDQDKRTRQAEQEKTVAEQTKPAAVNNQITEPRPQTQVAAAPIKS